ncbi:putative bifunctional enoyl-CoA hydratase/phosphate acetyltransferase [Bordetella bronchiseptica SBL-F6116]|nr:putative bifunctional enoyl-CoA hydratase/phosphate acetyltransferase [Bordetella bronchiseptica SBL-F6116]
MSATRHNHYERLIAHARTLPALPCAVAHPCDETSLGAALQAMQLGLLTPILVGPQQKIRDVAERCGLDLGGAAIVDAPHSHAAAAAAVQLVRGGQASLLMKGSLHTDELMHEVVARDTGLRTERRISHVFIMDVPTYPEPLFITDAAINIFPDLETKADIVRNAIALHLGLGLGEPRVAILSAVEQVMPSIPSTLEAAALCKMADRGQIQGGILTARWRWTTPSAPRPRRSRASSRRWPAARRSWWCPTWKPATCWPRTSASWPTPRPPASCSARACPSS